MDDTMQLGGNIELSGFSGVDGASMIVLKKIIGNYGKHFSEIRPWDGKVAVGAMR